MNQRIVPQTKLPLQNQRLQTTLESDSARTHAATKCSKDRAVASISILTSILTSI
jgi:hypothetical protein